MPQIFKAAQGYLPVDLVHFGLDHLSAAEALFKTNPSHYDSAGYLAHLGVELLLKAWLLEAAGQFDGIHHLETLYGQLVAKHGAPTLSEQHLMVLQILDQYEELRYPDRNQPTEVGDEDWRFISELVGFLCREMPQAIQAALAAVEPGSKAGRVLMSRKIDPANEGKDIPEILRPLQRRIERPRR